MKTRTTSSEGVDANKRKREGRSMLVEADEAEDIKVMLTMPFSLEDTFHC